MYGKRNESLHEDSEHGHKPLPRVLASPRPPVGSLAKDSITAVLHHLKLSTFTSIQTDHQEVQSQLVQSTSHCISKVKDPELGLPRKVFLDKSTGFCPSQQTILIRYSQLPPKATLHYLSTDLSLDSRQVSLV